MRLFSSRRRLSVFARCDSPRPPDRNRAASAVSRKRSFLVKPIATFLTRQQPHNRASGGTYFSFGRCPETVYVPTTVAARISSLLRYSVLTEVGVIFSHYRKTYRRFYSFFNTFIGRIYIYLCVHSVG